MTHYSRILRITISVKFQNFNRVTIKEDLNKFEFLMTVFSVAVAVVVGWGCLKRSAKDYKFHSTAAVPTVIKY